MSHGESTAVHPMKRPSVPKEQLSHSIMEATTITTLPLRTKTSRPNSSIDETARINGEAIGKSRDRSSSIQTSKKVSEPDMKGTKSSKRNTSATRTPIKRHSLPASQTKETSGMSIKINS